MHPNPIFRQETDWRNIAFIRSRAFGVLAINGPNGPETASIPALLSEDGQHLDCHLVRSNPIAKALQTPTDAVFLVSGPDSYVSPDWYGAPDQVPTWNYVAARIKGMAHLRPEADLRPILDHLSAHFEDQLHPKPPWTSDKMTPSVLTRMMRSIVPCRLEVQRIDATWKLSQNKPSDVRARAAASVDQSGIGLAADQVAKWMRDLDAF